MKKKLTAFLLLVALCVSVLTPMGTAKAATTITYDDFSISESEVYSFQNVASGWYMNVKHAGTSNGTQINLYPLDMSEPMTQRYVFHIVDADKKVVQISPQPVTNKYLDVRRNGKAFAAGQGICIWEADGDPIKNLVLEFQEDGSFYLSFEKYPEYCIGAKSLSAASTEQTQLVVREKENAPELRWILCDKNGLPVMDVENNTDNWENPYYEKYGQDYIDLFKDNPEYLTNEAFAGVTARYFAECRRVLADHENEALLGSVLYALDNGKDVVIYELLSKIGLSKTFSEKIRLGAIRSLIQDICNDQNTLDTMFEEVQADFEGLDTAYELSSEALKEKYISNLVKATSVPSEQVEKIVDESLKKGSKVIKIAGTGIELTACLTTAMQLYCLEQSMIDYLMESVDTGSDMYQDLQLLKDNIGNNAYKHITETFLSEGSLKLISTAVSKIAAKGNLSLDLASVVVDVGVSVLVNNVYQGALADKIAQTTYLYSYALTLENTLLQMQTTFMDENHVVTVEDIERYEVVFSSYLSALKTMVKSAEKMDKKNYSTISDLLENSKDYWNYDSYITMCLKNMPNVQKRLDELVEKLNGKYFTVNQEVCKSSRTYNCGVANIIKDDWFKNSFLNGGSISTSQFPLLTVGSSGKDRSGYSCFGFACFAEWYLYSDGIKDNVTAYTVATGKYNKDFLRENVKVGDALRIMGANGAHTVVVYSVDETGLTVLDSNFYLDCRVEKHFIKYTHASFLNRTVYVDRVVD